MFRVGTITQEKNKMNWSSAVAAVTPFVVKIQTQHQYGTGFIFWQNEDMCCIATANHIIEPANQEGWEQPIHITQPNGKSLRFYPEHRWLAPRLNDGDSAAIVINKSGFEMPDTCLPLWGEGTPIPVGTDIGWLGYPGIVHDSVLQPCFFSGVISNYFHNSEQYAIDGVAIHGVSGGPVFCHCEKTGLCLIGSISSYEVNRVPVIGGVEAWPGLLVSHSVSAFKPIVEDLNIRLTMPMDQVAG